MMNQTERLEINIHCAGVALRKAILMAEGSELFNDIKDLNLTIAVMVDYCAEALKALGQWTEDDEEEDPDEVE